MLHVCPRYEVRQIGGGVIVSQEVSPDFVEIECVLRLSKLEKIVPVELGTRIVPMGVVPVFPCFAKNSSGDTLPCGDVFDLALPHGDGDNSWPTSPFLPAQ